MGSSHLCYPTFKQRDSTGPKYSAFPYQSGMWEFDILPSLSPYQNLC